MNATFDLETSLPADEGRLRMRSEDELAVESSKGDANSTTFARLFRLVLSNEKLEVIQVADVNRRRILVVAARLLSSGRIE